MNVQVTGCIDCPMCDMLDMAPGYKCNLFPTDKGYIKQNKFFMPDTPDWCPLIKGSVTIEKVASDKELTEFATAVSLSSIQE